MKEALHAALETLKRRGADYGEVRASHREQYWNGVRNREVEIASSSDDNGVCIRVWHHGAWGAAATQDLSVDSLVNTAKRAFDIACSGKLAAREPVALEEGIAQVGSFQTPVQRDPFEVPVSERFDLLFETTDRLRKDPLIISAKSTIVALRRTTHLLTTTGSDLKQSIVVTGGGMQAAASDGSDIQVRSFPKDHEGNVLAGGWEVIDSFNLIEETERVREEAIELLKAPVCPSGLFTVILKNSQLSLHVHETCGHPSELDRALGDEISLAGASFLTPDRRRNYTYGSPIVNLTADATHPQGAGTFGWDDEGVPAGQTPLVKEGQFVDYLSNRESAARIGTQSSGAARANGWSALPIVRMVNINLEPQSGSLDDLIGETDHGLILDTNKSWSIDDVRLNFQFSCESAREIRNGKLGTLYKNPMYTGITPQFWGGCDRICGPEAWEMWGYFFCGKGDPIQSIHVGHGVAPARFQNVQVGTTAGGA